MKSPKLRTENFNPSVGETILNKPRRVLQYSNSLPVAKVDQKGERIRHFNI